jgi:hypothetical protein
MNRSLSVKMIAFWDIRPCSLTAADKRFIIWAINEYLSLYMEGKEKYGD